MTTEFFLGVGLGVILTIVMTWVYRFYCVVVERYLIARMHNELQQELINAKRKILDNTIQQLENHANDED